MVPNSDPRGLKSQGRKSDESVARQATKQHQQTNVPSTVTKTSAQDCTPATVNCICRPVVMKLSKRYPSPREKDSMFVLGDLRDICSGRFASLWSLRFVWTREPPTFCGTHNFLRATHTHTHIRTRTHRRALKSRHLLRVPPWWLVYIRGDSGQCVAPPPFAHFSSI